MTDQQQNNAFPSSSDELDDMVNYMANPTFDVQPGGTLTADITRLTPGGQLMARMALEAWSNVTGIRFELVRNDNAHIWFDDEEFFGFVNYERVKDGFLEQVFVNMYKSHVDDLDAKDDIQTVDGLLNPYFMTYMHEVGHALGLWHPGPYSGYADESDRIFGNLDSTAMTVMSYFFENPYGYYAGAMTPMLADIYAIQSLYGKPDNINAGDTVHGYNSNVDGYLGEVFRVWTAEDESSDVRDPGWDMMLTLYDNGGNDTLDLRTDTHDQRVDLNPFSVSDVYGRTGNLFIHGDTLIENHVAGSGDDHVTGNRADNRLNGGAGADYLDGGAGSDTVDYSDSDAGVTVSLATGEGSRGHAQGDELVSIEGIIGTAFDDRLTGDSGNNVLAGGGGADNLDGGAGSDTVDYSDSDAGVTVSLATGEGSRGHAQGDELVNIEGIIGTAFDDRLTGDNGNNVLAGGGGADNLEGGAGSDTVDYSASDAGVTVDLVAQEVSGGHAQGDRIAGFESVIGSAFEDRLTGDNRDNVLAGGGGADNLDGGAGSDTVDYSDSDAGVTVDLATGEGAGGHAQGDRIAGIESVIGSVFGDQLSGDNNNNSLIGGAGDDHLYGGGGADDLDGGAGSDTVDYSDSHAGVTVNLATGEMSSGHAQGDRIAGIESIIGSAYDDRLTGDNGNNSLIGDSGNDNLQGGGGNDYLSGGAGADRLDGGAGTDWLSYAGSDGPVSVRLYDGYAARGHAEGDTISGFENLRGSAHPDALAGSGRDNRLEGGAGNDQLWGGSGDDVLEGGVGNDRLWGENGDDVLEGGVGTDHLDGGAGSDTVDYSDSYMGILVNLTTGETSGGHAEGDRLVGIESVIGSVFDDQLSGDNNNNSLIGGAGDDRLEGGPGADRLAGGGGDDYASYTGSTGGVTVRLHAFFAKGGDAEGDTFIGAVTVRYNDEAGVRQEEELPDIMHLLGSPHDDILAGDRRNNTIYGDNGDDVLYGGFGGGNDQLYGGEGDDTLYGGAGDDYLGGHGGGIFGEWHVIGSDDDHLYGGAGDDVLYGSVGNDNLQGGAGQDGLDGGAGLDTANYETSDAGVTVNLATGEGGGGHAQGDELVNIEAVTGSPFDDHLTGDNGNNSLDGGSGDDHLYGGGGADYLDGGAGADYLDGGAGSDTVHYGASDAGVIVDLLAQEASGGHAQGDRIAGIESVVGSAFDDRLTGDSGNNVLAGGGGADDLDGGAGSDTVDYSASDAGVTVDLATGEGAGGHAQGDRIAGFESVIGSAYEDRLTGDSGNNSLDGGAGDDHLHGGAGADNLDGGAGSDTADYSASDAGVTVNLATGEVSGGHAQGDKLVSIEGIIGTAFDDRLTGDSGNNVLAGGGGADNLEGGAGSDTVDYSASDAGVTVDLVAQEVSGGHAQGDRIAGIESVIGSAFEDRLTGDNRDNVLAGGGGADNLEGGAGSDTVDYSASDAGVIVDLAAQEVSGGHAQGDRIAGIESVIGSAFEDRLTGDSGNNVLAGGGGADNLDGGAGSDTVDYSDSHAGVTVNLATGEMSSGHAQGDRIAGIESIIGSAYDDRLTGDNGNNSLIGDSGNDNLQGGGGSDNLNGGAGDDHLQGGGGADYLDGDAGNDSLHGGAGDDHLQGGGGADDLDGGAGSDTVDYSASDREVTVNLATGEASGGHAAGDQLARIESVVGSAFNDRLTGDSGSNSLIGGAGNDQLYGSGGADYLDGGADWDAVFYHYSDEGVTVNLTTGQGAGGHAQGDELINIESVFGSSHDDTLTGDAGNNSLIGGPGNDNLHGGAGDDGLEGRSGNDNLYGGEGNDRLYGGEGNDNLNGGAGHDQLYVSAGNNNLYGGAGLDALFGGPGADHLDGGADWDSAYYFSSNAGVTVNLATGEGTGGYAQGDELVNIESVFGSNFNDTLTGDVRDNYLIGRAGDDHLHGAEGNDRLWGDAGSDNLDGGVGNDELRGGPGADTFVFAGGHGNDVVTDFTDGEDRIDLTAFGLAGFDDLSVSSDSGSVTIDLTAHNGGTIQLSGFEMANLDASDFIFVS